MLRLPQNYITALEEVLKIKLSEEQVHNSVSHKKLQQIARAVQQISEGLTKQHGDFVKGKYLKEKEFREAYLLYYMSTNLLKLWPPLRELSSARFFQDRTTINHLDLGSGTGTAIWSFLGFVEENLPSLESYSFLLSDYLDSNLESARGVYKRLSASPSLKVKDHFEKIDASKLPELRAKLSKEKGFDLITMMNVVNEIPEVGDEELIEILLGALKEDGVLIMIEPSAREQSRRALRFRDKLVGAGAFVFAPCTRTNGCPALLEEDNWCHSEIEWERPGFIKYIDDQIGTLRLSLKYTYATVLKQDSNLSDLFQPHRDFYGSGRIVSELFREKGRSRAFICNEKGRHEYVQNKRDIEERNSGFAEADRYDLVVMSGIEDREHDKKVGKGASFHKVMSSEGASYVDNSILSEKK